VAVISLLTDFGLADSYVGQMKAAILAIAPEASIVDVTHGVPPQDVQAGAFLLWSAVEAFPAGSIHLAVVDPGVGSSRRAIAIRVRRGDILVGPDNGLLLKPAHRLGGVEACVELTDSTFWRPTPSQTFHGRDVFGPVAAHLALGVTIDRLGPAIDDPVDAAGWPEPSGLNGQVIHVDGYGNLITNLPADALPEAFRVRIGHFRVPRAAFYEAVQPGQLLALVGSTGLLEVSARGTSAARLMAAQRGARVTVEPL
jgi:S-adenosylmethionine hydrolase